MADVKGANTHDDASRAMARFATLVRRAIMGEASGQIRAARATEHLVSARVDGDFYKVRLTPKQLDAIGQEAAGGAALKKRVELFKNYTPEAYAEKVKEWTTRVCESERDKLTAAHAARERAEDAASESAGDSGAYERVTAANLADLVEEADEGDEAYVLECNALPKEPKVPEFQKKLGRIALSAIQDIVATREKNENSSHVSVGGVLVLTLQVKPDGKVSVIGIESQNGFEYNRHMSRIRAELNHRLREMSAPQLPAGEVRYLINFNSTAETTPQMPPVAVPMTS